MHYPAHAAVKRQPALMEFHKRLRTQYFPSGTTEQWEEKQP